MICTSLGNVPYDKALSITESSEMVELRLDLSGYTESQVRELCSCGTPVVATCRYTPETSGKVVALLAEAVSSGALYIDLELEMPSSVAVPLMEEARRKGCGIIRSSHSFGRMPGADELRRLMLRCLSDGDVAKIVAFAHSREDCETILSLYSYPGNLIAFAMGEAGTYSRMEALRRGAPFMYASACGVETAPGQLDALSMYEMCYGQDAPLAYARGTADIPVSKSTFQRTVIAAALAGERIHTDMELCDDSRHSVEFAEMLLKKNL